MRFFRTLLYCVVLLALTRQGVCAGPPKAGDTLPDLVFQNTLTPQEQEYLGVEDTPTFSLSQIGAQVILFEFFGVYCPICHDQAPDFNRLVKRLNRDAATAEAVRVVALAAGATTIEMEHARKSMKAEYPMLNDPDFSLHTILGEPKTPFTLVLRPDGRVLWSHIGRIEDSNALFDLIRGALSSGAGG